MGHALWPLFSIIGSNIAILLALFVSAVVAFAEAPVYGSQPIDNPAITAKRLDRAVDFILSQDPPFITHGSLYGDCPFWSGGDPNVFVICIGSRFGPRRTRLRHHPFLHEDS